jgi:hypothetical protein
MEKQRIGARHNRLKEDLGLGSGHRIRDAGYRVPQDPLQSVRQNAV